MRSAPQKPPFMQQLVLAKVLLEDPFPQMGATHDIEPFGAWRYRPIEAGELFFYTEVTFAPDETRPTCTITQHELYPETQLSVSSVDPRDVVELVELLERVEETPTMWLRRLHGGQTAMRILDVLVADGRLTMDEVKAITNDGRPPPQAF